MNRPIVVTLLLLGAAPAGAQESLRRLEQRGDHSKYLTPNQEDRWAFRGRAGEVVAAEVRTEEFDAVLALVDDSGTVLEERDDPGSASRLAHRLGADGDYQLRVHAFMYSGGGNYTLTVDQFVAGPLPIGEETRGTIGRDGRAHHRFDPRPGQLLVPRIEGPVAGAEALDPQGRPLSGWEGTAAIARDGEHYLRIRGAPETAYRLTLMAAERRDLGRDRPEPGRIAPGGLHVWDISGAPGELRVVEVRDARGLEGRLVPADPPGEEAGQEMLEPRSPSLRFLPVSSKGDRLRYAAVLGREGRYELQLHSRASRPVEYEAALSDPSVPIALDASEAGELAVGGTDFYRFETQAGRSIEAELSSSSFDPLLRLSRADGEPVAVNDDGGDDLDSRISLLIPETGPYRLHVSSVGDGGGGPYRLRLRRQPVPEIGVGGRSTGRLGEGGRALWRFSGRRDQAVFVSVRSGEIDPAVEVLSPSGVSLGRDDDGGVGSDSLLALRLPEDGSYTVVVESRAGEGEFQVRLIDGE